MIVIESWEKQESSEMKRMFLSWCHVSCNMRSFVKWKTLSQSQPASEEIRHDLLGAEEIGKTILKEFVQDMLIKKDIKFHDRG